MPFVKIVQNPMIHCSLALFAVVSGPNASILTLPRPENRVESRGVHAKNQCDSGTHIVAYDSSLCLEIEQLGLVSESKRIITQEFTIKNIWTFFMECFWLSGHILQTMNIYCTS